MKMYVKPFITDVFVLIEAYYIHNPAGGNCHGVLDDYNINDENLMFCLKLCRKKNDPLGSSIMLLMLLMSKTQRLKLVKGKYNAR